MEEFKGTKGKWGIDSKNNVIDYLGDEIAICPEWRTTSKANALLIKHSKEMLELLIQLRDTEDFGASEWKQIDILIKQATEI